MKPMTDQQNFIKYVVLPNLKRCKPTPKGRSSYRVKKKLISR